MSLGQYYQWRVSSSGMWLRLVCWVATDVSEEHIASIFRVEEIISCLLPACLLVLAEIISSTLKMEAICFSETLVATQQTTRRHIPEDDTFHNHLCDNLKSHKCFHVFTNLSFSTPCCGNSLCRKCHIRGLYAIALLINKQQINVIKINQHWIWIRWLTAVW
jgi:hypothetical protein